MVAELQEDKLNMLYWEPDVFSPRALYGNLHHAHVHHKKYS